MRCLIYVAIIVFPLPLSAATPFEHSLLDEILQTYVDTQGGVDYLSLKSDRANLDSYTDSLALYSPLSHPQLFPTSDHELAYWINAYNAFVLRGVIDAYPVDSVMDIKYFNGFFNRQQFIAGGKKMTLDHIGNQIIRPVYKDPRIHFVVNCGAISCPALENQAFSGPNLNKRLAAAQIRFMNNPQHLLINRQTPALYLSKILDWYGEDFINWNTHKDKSVSAIPTLLDYLILFLPQADADFLRQHPDIEISFYEYNWQLNKQSGKK